MRSNVGQMTDTQSKVPYDLFGAGTISPPRGGPVGMKLLWRRPDWGRSLFEDAISLVPGLRVRAATFWPIVRRAKCLAALC